MYNSVIKLHYTRERARLQELESTNLTLTRLSTLTNTQFPGEKLFEFSLKSMGVEILAFRSQRDGSRRTKI